MLFRVVVKNKIPDGKHKKGGSISLAKGSKYLEGDYVSPTNLKF